MIRIVLACSLFSYAAAAAVVWQEAEALANTGRWSNDSQHVDIMGSPYLLATGCGEPVADAVGQVSIPEDGRYRLWVRCRDWYPSHSPGQFRVVVGGQPSGVAFGKAADDAWRWVDGGEFSLRAGETELRLQDLTGWWGRCDAIVLASGDFLPANDPGTLAEQRLAHAGVSLEIADAGSYDVVVVGAGSAGLGAALAAAREGIRVAFIQDRPILGGNSSDEIRVPPMGYIGNAPDRINVTGIAEEIYPVQGWSNFGSSAHYARIVAREPNIALFLNTRATGVEMADAATIASVLALNVHSGQRLRFSAPLFIDTTGHGWIGYYARADYRHGTEARDQHNEAMAPLEASPHTMGNSLYKTEFATTDAPCPFPTPPWAYQWRSPADFAKVPGRDGEPIRHESFDKATRGPGRPVSKLAGGYTWFMETGGMRDTIRDAEAIRDELFRMHIGIWGYQKNYQQPEKLRHRKLVWLNYVPGVRESRRLLGDYIMTQRDFDDSIQHPDTVAFTDWGIDDHHPQGFFTKGMDVLHVYHGRRINIPFRSLYSRNIANLFMAGRCMSASHLALGGVRVQRPMTATGQAVGTAAAIASRAGIQPREVYESHIEELQQRLLKAGCYLPGMRNQDPQDLARRSQTRHRALIDGWNREVTRISRAEAWRGTPLEFRFAKVETVASLHLSLANRHNALVFAVEAETGGQWRELARSQGGQKQRRHVLNFPPVQATAIRCKLLRCSAPVSVCEVRIYAEPGVATDDSGDEAPPDLPGLLCDDADAEFRGSWTASSWGKASLGLGYQHDGDARDGKASATFAIDLPKPGRYQVRLGFLAHSNRATRVPVAIVHAGGTATSIVDQTKPPPGGFLSLGTYNFQKQARIIVSNAGSDGYVIADGVQLLPSAESAN
jgi:hypothetical protein